MCELVNKVGPGVALCPIVHVSYSCLCFFFVTSKSMLFYELVVYCSSLDCPQNGHVSISLMQHCGSPARCGSAARFRCNPGFAVLGSVYQDCRVTGKWHGVPPSCHGICEYITTSEAYIIYKLTCDQ